MRILARTALVALVLEGWAAAPSPLGAQQLVIAPRQALSDEAVAIRMTGLVADAPVEIRATRTDSAGRPWTSVARFRANAAGVVDVSSMTPVDGSYSGVRPMGLFTSLDLAGELRGKARYAYGWRDTLRTAVVVEAAGRIVASDTLMQTFSGRGVRAHAVRSNGLVGTWFLPAPGRDAKTSALLILGGSEGGLGSEDVAALLASRGYAALALAYFNADSLPAALDRIPLEYFSTALRWIAAQRTVRSDRIMVFGTSKGAEAALALASQDTMVRAVVAYQPSSVVWSCICGAPHASWTSADADLPFVPAGTDPTYRPAAGAPIRPVVNYRYRMQDPAVRAQAAIPVERIRGPLLLVAGGDDGLWPSAEMARAIANRRRQTAAARNDVVLEYPGAGHLIGKAFLPAGSTLIGGGRLDTGGTPEANAAAQADAWPQVLRFLQRLSQP